eukprot:12965518-Alexandrium_andersonii.AAC.1
MPAPAAFKQACAHTRATALARLHERCAREHVRTRASECVGARARAREAESEKRARERVPVR